MNETKPAEVGETAKKTTEKKPEIKLLPEPKKKEPKQSEIALEMWNQYLTKNVVNKFSSLPPHIKLCFIQAIPYDLLEWRTINGVDFPYIPHEFSEKALNFVFDFAVNAEVVKTEFETGTHKKANGQTVKYWEAMLEVKFTFYDHSTDRSIVKTVFAGHKSFENPATTKADCAKSALSKAYTIVARQFGIGSNIKGTKKRQGGKAIEVFTPMVQVEKEAYKKMEEPKIEEIKKPTIEKSFASPSHNIQVSTNYNNVGF